MSLLHVVKGLPEPVETGARKWLRLFVCLAKLCRGDSPQKRTGMDKANEAVELLAEHRELSSLKDILLERMDKLGTKLLAVQSTDEKAKCQEELAKISEAKAVLDARFEALEKAIERFVERH